MSKTHFTPGPEHKLYYVSWEGYSKGTQPDGCHELDRCCLQGPHTLENAKRIAEEIRSAGQLASVIDCKSSLWRNEDPLYSAAPELYDIVDDLLANVAWKNINPVTLEKAKKLLAKARGENA